MINKWWSMIFSRGKGSKSEITVLPHRKTIHLHQSFHSGQLQSSLKKYLKDF